MNDTITKRIEANRGVYERLLKDLNYTDVKFNPNNGALSAIHKDHHFDPTIGKFGVPRGDYELNSQKVLYEYGHSVVLESEKLGKGIKTPDGLLNGVVFDIKGVEGVSDRLIKDAISKSSSQGAEIAVLYFHKKDMFVRDDVRDGYEKYLTNSRSKRVRKVFCIVEDHIYRL